MKCSEILQHLEKDFPTYKAYEWDNVGLLVGRDDKNVQKIFVALDATDEIIEAAKQWGADMLLTHHPLIFAPLKKINNQNFIANRVIELLQADLSYYAMHTNYDIVKMADLASERLGLLEAKPLEVSAWDAEEGLGKIGRVSLEQPIDLAGYGRKVKEAFGLTDVKVFGDLTSKVETVAILPGSGKSAIEAAIAQGADVLITGDIGHHEGIDANSRGLAIIDAGHYGVEHIFIEDMCKYLKDVFVNDGIEVKGAGIVHPFAIV